jgi:hypothetical protein
MTKVHYLNNHLEKFREEKRITINLENIGNLAQSPNMCEENKKTTTIFTECFNNKETYKELLKKLPKNTERLGIYYLITVYWIAYTCHYHNHEFDKAMGDCLESTDQNVILLDSPHFCKKVYHYLMKPELV